MFESVTNAESIDGSVRKEILKKDVLEKMNKKEKSSIQKKIALISIQSFIQKHYLIGQ